MNVAVYNEIEPYTIEWLRNLVADGLVAPGLVETRSIKELAPDDVRHATQFHAFAGIGVWSYALRLAGWPDDVSVWTGSCPCQPFSGAGKRLGFSDERHLWPAWFDLIRECQPPIIFGEQVASPDGLAWFDIVSAELEGEGYSCGATDLCAAGVGAPHIRQRLYFVAVAGGQRRDRFDPHLRERRPRETVLEAARRGAPGSMADPAGERADERAAAEPRGDRAQVGVPWPNRADGVVLGDTVCARLEGWQSEQRDDGAKRETAQRAGGATRGLAESTSERQRADELGRDRESRQFVVGSESRSAGRDDGAARGFWSNADWLLCRDGKARPVEPGSFPLAHGASARVGRLRAYGNAIVPQVAATFIRAVMEVLGDV